MEEKGRCVRLKAPVPDGELQLGHFVVGDVDVNTTIAEGQLLLDVLVLSADPFQRGRFKTATADSIVGGYLAGRVRESKDARYPKGALVGAFLPFQTPQVVTVESATSMWDVSPYVSGADISLAVGALGMPGATAWGGLLDVLRPKKGETLFVSAASGAVGSLVGQIAAKHVGCTVIGSVGGPAKADAIRALGFHHTIDYRQHGATTASLVAALRAVAPDGIDMNFENVGGPHFDAAFQCLRVLGRVAVCGAISQYDKPSGGQGDAASAPNHINIATMIYTRQRVEGFLASPYLQNGAFLKDMHAWIKSGLLVTHETPFNGIDSWPEAMLAVMSGRHMGKVVVHVAKLDGDSVARL